MLFHVWGLDYLRSRETHYDDHCLAWLAHHLKLLLKAETEGEGYGYEEEASKGSFA